MTTITLELTDEQTKLLAEEAKRLSLPMQEVAARRLFAGWQSTGDEGSSMEFEEAMEYVFQKNSELYRRLVGRRERVSEAIRRIIDKNEELYRRLA